MVTAARALMMIVMFFDRLLFLCFSSLLVVMLWFDGASAAPGGRSAIAFSSSLSVPRGGDYGVNRAWVQSAPASVLNALELVDLEINSQGEVFIGELPKFLSKLSGRYAARTARNEVVRFSLDSELQEYSNQLLASTQSPHAALVALEPSTGRLLALAQKSNSLDNAALHSGYPAASLFKIVTAAAAVERGVLRPDSRIGFHGGVYTLDRSNYRPDNRRDRLFMTLAEALGTSCNPVFARVALRHLDGMTLAHYARAFGFNSDLAFDRPLQESSAVIPAGEYELSRTAAGFGPVHISPLHAALLTAAVANRGVMPRPFAVDLVHDLHGNVLYRAQGRSLLQALQPWAAEELLRMMEATVTSGTSRSEFYRGSSPRFPEIGVAAKTGTLRGKNPPGLNKWFVAAAPLSRPKVVVAAVVVDPNSSEARPSRIGRKFLERYFRENG
jgi:penicillin-binding protein A